MTNDEIQAADPGAQTPVRKRVLTPRDAATLIVVDRSSDAAAVREPRILMGHRSGRHVFMPNTFVFPGGRLDAEDAGVPVASALREPVLERLTRKASARKARALACTAIRETFEETGLMVGTAHNGDYDPQALAPDWREVFGTGLAPRLDCLDYVARAVTPPNNVRRFNARFFIVDSRNTSGELGGSGELVDLQWIPIADALAMPNTPDPTSIALREVRRLLAEGDPWNLPSGHAVPVYLARYGKDVLEYD
jgi:8-oxo-dGTP pyrophosphatase MutT (NUDIX family)